MSIAFDRRAHVQRRRTVMLRSRVAERSAALSRRSAIGRLAAASAAMAGAAGGFPASRVSARGAVSSIGSSLATTLKGFAMTDATPAASPAASPLTVVLVHGAFADGSSWTGVIERLQAAGVKVVAPANPLRGISHDSAYTASYINQIPGPVLAVGHSYGGAIISNAATNAKNVVGLVFVAAFAPDDGEVLGQVAATSKDSILG